MDARRELDAGVRRERALRAAVGVAQEYGVNVGAARILEDWNDTIVHLAPAPLVARVRTTWLDGGEVDTLRREIAIAGHAAARGAPVVEPSRDPPPGPHRFDNLTLTFWEYVETVPGDVPAREAGIALRRLHNAIDDYAGELPPLSDRLDRAQRVADDPTALQHPPENERQFLAESLRSLRSRFEGFALAERALHGGPHLANLLRTPSGPRWIDLDTACVGPLEWDLAHLPETAADAFAQVDPQALEEARLLVSAAVAVSCWRTYGRAPAVDNAARFHLGRLRMAAGELRITTFADGHRDGFRSLVEDTLREFGFEPDPEMDPDLEDPAGTYAALWVVLSGEQVVGSVALRDLGDGALELKRMYLRPEQRGLGLGKKLLATAIDWAREHGARVVKLDTSERMETARALYDAHGFTRVPGYAPRQGQHRLLYELRL